MRDGTDESVWRWCFFYLWCIRGCIIREYIYQQDFNRMLSPWNQTLPSAFVKNRFETIFSFVASSSSTYRHVFSIQILLPVLSSSTPQTRLSTLPDMTSTDLSMIGDGGARADRLLSTLGWVPRRWGRATSRLQYRA